METFVLNNPGLTIGIALAAGMAAQTLAHHIRVPGIAILLITGVLLGPDAAGVVRPGSLGQALPTITGFAVAIILFEGGLNLRVSRLRREQRPIRRLLFWAAPLTVAGGAAAAHGFLGWDWRTSFLFGTLVMVTGPTVVTPLLRRISVKRNVAIILEAEGVLIDALGAVVATVALEAALSPVTASPATFILHLVSCLGFGAAAGLAGGYLLAWFVRIRLLPEGMENVFTLSFVAALFQAANAFMPESGVAAVTTAGIVMGNVKTPIRRELAEFKEQITVLLIAMMFVLLAADVRLEQVLSLGWPGAFTVLALMFVVRPAAVAVAMQGTGVKPRERLFIGWIGPRGIIAAAVASLFAARLEASGYASGQDLRAMVFVVITATVLMASLTGGAAASLLKLKRPRDFGWVILGANELARALSLLLQEGGHEVVLIDANPDVATAAEKDCTRVLFGNGLQTRTLLRAEIDTRMGAVAVTPNVEVNLLFVQNARREAKRLRLLLSLDNTMGGVTPKMAVQAGAQAAFGGAVDVNLWCVRLRRSQALLIRYRFAPESPEGKDKEAKPDMAPDGNFIPLVHRRSGKVQPVGGRMKYAAGDEVAALVFVDRLSQVEQKMKSSGWEEINPEIRETFTLSQCVLPPGDATSKE